MNAFATEDEARAAVIAACHRLSALGLNHGKSGNVSVRWHRGGADGLILTPSALPYEATTPDDLVWLSLADPPVVDGHRRPSSEWRFHHAILRTHAEAGAVVHTHAPHASALACLPRVQREGIPAFHYMVAAAGGRSIPCAGYATFGSDALSAAALSALQGVRACLLANHGMIAWGATLERALWLAVEVEALARMYATLLPLGEPALLGDEEMARVLARFADYRP